MVLFLTYNVHVFDVYIKKNRMEEKLFKESLLWVNKLIKQAAKSEWRNTRLFIISRKRLRLAASQRAPKDPAPSNRK